VARKETIKLWRLRCGRRSELSRSDDPCGFVAREREQVAFVARQEIISVARFRKRQQEVVTWIG
jgi:hypothetical protein